jgi:valyl-tRNA synthetase
MMNGLGGQFKPKESIEYLSRNVSSLRLMDIWILSRLGETVTLCDSSFKNYELHAATTALFNFWLYDLCDYYIEYLKPSFYASNVDEKQRITMDNSREVLYTCLDAGLRLISPFMPYLSEELYQRLTRRRPGTDAPSICVSLYPTPQDEFGSFKCIELEANVKSVQEAINKLRSLRADYQLTPKVKVDIYIQSFDAGLRDALSSFSDLILTMCNGKELQFLDERAAVPHGCAFSTLSDKCKLYVMLKGIIDVDKEELKLNKKKETLGKQIEALRKEMNTSNYETRVPEQVRVKNQEKVLKFFYFSN